MKRILTLAALASSSAFAQCVMCFRTAAAQQTERARVMNLGIIILLIPPVLILVGFMVLCYKRRKTYAEPPPEFKPAALELEEVLAGDRR